MDAIKFFDSLTYSTSWKAILSTIQFQIFSGKTYVKLKRHPLMAPKIKHKRNIFLLNFEHNFILNVFPFEVHIQQIFTKNQKFDDQLRTRSLDYVAVQPVRPEIINYLPSAMHN